MKLLIPNAFLMFAAVLAVYLPMREMPQRVARADASAAIRFAPVAVAPSAAAPLRFAGAWEITADDPRMGGVSALAFDRGELVALTDSGVVIRLPRPGPGRKTAIFRDLPDGPGDPRWKSRRDSEALVRMLDGDWLVAFENRNQVWRYDAEFRTGRKALDFDRKGWPRNRGIEAMVLDEGDRLLLIAEGSHSLISVDDVEEHYPLDSEGWTVSDAARLPDGRLLALLRQATLTGFRNAIGTLVATDAGWRVAMIAPLPLGRFDNAEGLAAEALSSGGTRMWVITDNDADRFRRTLLAAFDLPPTKTNARRWGRASGSAR